MWWALWGFLVFCGSATTFSHSSDSAVDLERFDDNSMEDYDYDYEDWLNYFLIYPGTKWCGKGDIAADDNDLGRYSETDMCCRAHDKCPETIDGFGTKYGLTNPAPYTRLSCDCDEKFRNCLKNTKDDDDRKVSSMVGPLYFDGLNTKCFELAHKIVGCEELSTLGTRCLAYKFDPASPKTYQWFDVKNYNEK